jgi:hypothetical protein
LKKLLADFKTLYRKQQVLEQTSCALPYHIKNPAGAGQADCGWFRLKSHWANLFKAIKTQKQDWTYLF